MLARSILTRSFVAVLGAMVLAPAGLAQGQLWRVDDEPGPDVDFGEIQAAIDAAVDGDLIVVADGRYLAFTIDGKALTVIGENPGGAVIEPDLSQQACIVRGLAPAQKVTLRQLVFFRGLTVFGPTWILEDNQGLLWLEDLSMVTDLPTFIGIDHNQAEAALIEDCASVTISRSLIFGLGGVPFSTFTSGLEGGGIGIRAARSTLYLSNVLVRGGSTAVEGGMGRPGIRVDDCTLIFRGSTVQGGGGGFSSPFGFTDPGTGGPGIDADSISEIWSIASDVLGGLPGQDDITGELGQPGLPFDGGVVTEHAGSEVGLISPVSVEAGSILTLGLTAEPNSIVVVMGSIFPNPVFLDVFPDTSFVGLDPLYFTAGLTDANGALSFDLPTPPIPSFWGHFGYPLQAFAVTPTTDLEFSEPTFVTTVHPAP